MGLPGAAGRDGPVHRLTALPLLFGGLHNGGHFGCRRHHSDRALNSWYLVGTGNIWSLAGSLYGHLLILKLFIFAGMLGLAGLNRFRITPAIVSSLRESAAPADLGAISRSMALESGFAMLVLGLVA